MRSLSLALHDVRTLRDLKLDYLDLYLVHFPIAQEYVPFDRRYPPGWFFDPNDPHPRMRLDRVPLAETWAAMEELVTAGLVKHIGVSNYGTALLPARVRKPRVKAVVESRALTCGEPAP